MTSEIEIDMDHVVAFGQRIERPDRMSRSQWLEFWEDVEWQDEEPH